MLVSDPLQWESTIAFLGQLFPFAEEVVFVYKVVSLQRIQMAPDGLYNVRKNVHGQIVQMLHKIWNRRGKTIKMHAMFHSAYCV